MYRSLVLGTVVLTVFQMFSRFIYRENLGCRVQTAHGVNGHIYRMDIFTWFKHLRDNSGFTVFTV